VQIANYQDAIVAVLLPHREAFAWGLTDQLNADPALARDIAKSALGPDTFRFAWGSPSLPKLTTDAATTQPWQLPGSQAG
jgi:hypothetical protein